MRVNIFDLIHPNLWISAFLTPLDMKQKIEDLKTITHEMLKRNDENVNELEEVNHRYDVVEEMSSKGTSAEIELKKVSNWVDSKTKVLDDFNSKSSTLKQESLKTNQEI